MTRDHFTTLAAYNAWANARLYDAVGTLPADEVTHPRPAFFGSILGTLNHILVGDVLWLARFDGREAGIPALDTVLHDRLADLRAAREAFDARITAFVGALDPGFIETGTLNYRSIDGTAFSNPVRWVLTHLFNHQTHHRGQVHDMLSQTAVAPPPLDFMVYVRAQA